MTENLLECPACGHASGVASYGSLCARAKVSTVGYRRKRKCPRCESEFFTEERVEEEVKE